MAKTRRHLMYYAGKVMNTGKDYSPKPAPLPLDGTVYANQRDIRGHGKNTSRVKRTRRHWIEGIGQHYITTAVWLDPYPTV